MLDSTLKPVVDKALDPAGRWCLEKDIKGEWLSGLSLFLGLSAAFAIGLGFFDLGLGLFILNRLSDGLNGALSRVSVESAFGRYIDLVFNFIVYGAVALGFGFYSASGGALTAAILVFSFLALGATTLGYAVMAKEAGLDSDQSVNAWIDFLSNLIGTSEMTLALLVMIMLPQYFGAIALVLALVCLVATCFRIIKAWLVLR